MLDNGALITLLATLLGTIGGFAVVISLAGFSQIRVWNRVVLMIAFFAFAFSADLLDRLFDRVRGVLTWPGPFVVVLAVAVGAFGLWDAGTPVVATSPRWSRDFTSDKEFVEAIERTVPDGTKVFQLPIVAFPEEPPYGRMLDYDLLRPFLQSDGSTDWSYGKVKGRPNADWQWMKVRDTVGIPEALPALVGLGLPGPVGRPRRLPRQGPGAAGDAAPGAGGRAHRQPQRPHALLRHARLRREPRPDPRGAGGAGQRATRRGRPADELGTLRSPPGGAAQAVRPGSAKPDRAASAASARGRIRAAGRRASAMSQGKALTTRTSE